jgi:hypothetical protein
MGIYSDVSFWVLEDSIAGDWHWWLVVGVGIGGWWSVVGIGLCGCGCLMEQ